MPELFVHHDYAAIDIDTGLALYSSKSHEVTRLHAKAESQAHREVAFCRYLEEQNTSLWSTITVYYCGKVTKRHSSMAARA